MKLTPEAVYQVRKVLSERGAMARPCAFCGQTKWIFANGFYFMPVQDQLPNINIAGSGMPLVAVICGNCGDTHLINLLILGLGNLFGKGDSPS